MTPNCGVYFYIQDDAKLKLHTRLSTKKRILETLIEQIPSVDIYAQNFHSNLTDWQPFFWKNYKSTIHYTYVLQGITEWLPGWKAKGWKTAAKQPVKNVDLWQRLDAVANSAGHHIDWRWVKGHAGDPGNERADALANLGVEKALGRL